MVPVAEPAEEESSGDLETFLFVGVAKSDCVALPEGLRQCFGSAVFFLGVVVLRNMSVVPLLVSFLWDMGVRSIPRKGDRLGDISKEDSSELEVATRFAVSKQMSGSPYTPLNSME